MSITTDRTLSIIVIIYVVAGCLFSFSVANASSATIDPAQKATPPLVNTAGASQTISHTDNRVAGRSPNTPDAPLGSATKTSDNDNTFVTLKNIRSILHEELQETTRLLDTINQKVSPRGFVARVADEAPTKIFWDFLVKPIVGWLFALLGTLAIFGKLTVSLRLRKARQEGHTSPIDERANSIITVVWYVLMILFVAMSVLIASASNVALRTSSIVMPDIADRLMRIEKLLGSLQQTVSPNPQINANPVLLVVAIFSILGLIVVSLTHSGHGVLLWPAPSVSPSTAGYGDAGKMLVAPIVLALIILMLPYPAKTLLLPFIFTYFIVAFFDLLHVYPNPGILRIVLKRYSILIYLAYYGVWSAFFGTILGLLDPFWIIIENSTLRDHGTTQEILRYSWQWAPIIMAMLAAIPGWRKVRLMVEKDRIPALRKELLSQEASLHRGQEEGGA